MVHYFNQVLFWTCLLLLSRVHGQFGIPKQEIEAPNNVASAQDQGEPFMSEQDALDLSAMVEAARKDPETTMLIHKMKREQSPELVELRKFSTDQIMLGMKQALDELKMVDLLFKDKHRAVEEMYKEGMIDKAHLKTYRKHPEQLEEDTRRALYFQFVSLAVVGDFL